MKKHAREHYCMSCKTVKHKIPRRNIVLHVKPTISTDFTTCCVCRGAAVTVTTDDITVYIACICGELVGAIEGKDYS